MTMERLLDTARANRIDHTILTDLRVEFEARCLAIVIENATENATGIEIGTETETETETWDPEALLQTVIVTYPIETEIDPLDVVLAVSTVFAGTLRLETEEISEICAIREILVTLH
jgi:hypothetical protein